MEEEDVTMFPPELNLYHHAKQHQGDMLSITPKKLRLREHILQESQRIKELMGYVSRTANKEMFRSPTTPEEESQLYRCLFGGNVEPCAEKSLHFDRVAYDIYKESFGNPVLVTKLKKMQGSEASKREIQNRIKEEGPLESETLQEMNEDESVDTEFLALEDCAFYQKEITVFAHERKTVEQFHNKRKPFDTLRQLVSSGAVKLKSSTAFSHPCTMLIDFEYLGAQLQKNAQTQMSVYIHPELEKFIEQIDMDWIDELDNTKKISISRQTRQLSSRRYPQEFENLKQINVKGFSDEQNGHTLLRKITDINRIARRFQIPQFLLATNRGSTFSVRGQKFSWVRINFHESAYAYLSFDCFVNKSTHEPYIPIIGPSEKFLYPANALYDNELSELNFDEKPFLPGEYLESDIETDTTHFSKVPKEGWVFVELFAYPKQPNLFANYAPWNQELILLHLLSRRGDDGRITLPFPESLVYKLKEGDKLEFPKGTNRNATILSLGNFEKSWLGKILPKSLAGEYYNRVFSLRMEGKTIIDIEMFASQEMAETIREINKDRAIEYWELRRLKERGPLYTFNYENAYAPVKVRVKGQEVVGSTMFMDPSFSLAGAASIVVDGMLGIEESFQRIVDKFNLGGLSRSSLDRFNSRALLIKCVSALTEVDDEELISRLTPLDENASLNDSLMIKVFEALKDGDFMSKLKGGDVVSLYGFSLGAAQSTLAALLIEISRRVKEVTQNKIMALNTAFFVGGSPRVVDHYGNEMLDNLFDHNRVKVNGKSKRSFHVIASVIRRSPSLCFQVLPDPYSCITKNTSFQITRPGFFLTQSIPTMFTPYFTKGDPKSQVRGYRVPAWLETNHPSGMRNKLGQRYIQQYMKGNINKIDNYKFMPYIFPFRYKGIDSQGNNENLFQGANKIQLDIGSLIQKNLKSLAKPWLDKLLPRFSVLNSLLEEQFSKEQNHFLQEYGNGFFGLHSIDKIKGLIENPSKLFMGMGLPTLPPPFNVKIDNGFMLTSDQYPNLTNNYAFTYIRGLSPSHVTIQVLQWSIDFWDQPQTYQHFLAFAQNQGQIMQINDSYVQFTNSNDDFVFNRLLQADYGALCGYAGDVENREEEPGEGNEAENNANGPTRKRAIDISENNNFDSEQIGKRRRN